MSTERPQPELAGAAAGAHPELPTSPDAGSSEGVGGGRPTARRTAGGSQKAATPVAASAGVHLSPVSWVADETLDRRRWIEHGRRLGRAGNSSGWWIGDWLRFGSLRYGEKYVLASRITGYDRQTLMNFAYVAARIQPHERRVDVSWSHHAELTNLDPPTRSAWLERVVTDRLSVRDLRRELRARNRRPPPPDPDAEVMRCPTCGQPLRRAGTEHQSEEGPQP